MFAQDKLIKGDRKGTKLEIRQQINSLRNEDEKNGRVKRIKMLFFGILRKRISCIEP